MNKFLALGGVVLIWGFYYLGVELSLSSGWDPHLLNATRFWIAALVLLLVLLLRGEVTQTIQIQKKHPLAVFTVAFFGVALGVGLLTLGQERVSSGISGVIASTTSLWTAVLGLLVFFGREHLRSEAWVGIVLGISGVFLLYAPWSDASSDTLGILLLLLGAVFLALEAQLILRWFSKLPFLPVTTLLVFWSGVLFTMAAIFWGDWSIGSVWIMLFISLGTICVAYALYIWLIREAGATFANTYAFFIPVVSLGAGWLLNEEEITLLILAGSGLCLMGAILVSRGVHLDKTPDNTET